MKKILVMLAAAIMLCSNVIAGNISEPCNIKDPDASPNNVAISYCITSLDITDGVAQCYGMTNTYPKYTPKLTVVLQQYDSGWKDIKTWVKSSTNSSVTISEPKNVKEGYSYRVKAVHCAIDKNGDVIESITKYSSTHKY